MAIYRVQYPLEGARNSEPWGWVPFFPTDSATTVASRARLDRGGFRASLRPILALPIFIRQRRLQAKSLMITISGKIRNKSIDREVALGLT
jgi:hypothetical protein